MTCVILTCVRRSRQKEADFTLLLISERRRRWPRLTAHLQQYARRRPANVSAPDIYFMGPETIPSACYIISDEFSIPFYSTSNGYFDYSNVVIYKISKSLHTSSKPNTLPTENYQNFLKTKDTLKQHTLQDGSKSDSGVAYKLTSTQHVVTQQMLPPCSSLRMLICGKTKLKNWQNGPTHSQL